MNWAIATPGLYHIRPPFHLQYVCKLWFNGEYNIVTCLLLFCYMPISFRSFTVPKFLNVDRGSIVFFQTPLQYRANFRLNWSLDFSPVILLYEILARPIFYGWRLRLYLIEIIIRSGGIDPQNYETKCH